MSSHTPTSELAKLVDNGFKSIAYILYNDANINLCEAFGENADSCNKRNHTECYNLVKRMKFELPLVYTRKYYNRLTQRPDDWMQRITLAMRVRDQLQKEMLQLLYHPCR